MKLEQTLMPLLSAEMFCAETVCRLERHFSPQFRQFLLSICI
jgi:hypothetical protein